MGGSATAEAIIFGVEVETGNRLEADKGVIRSIPGSMEADWVGSGKVGQSKV